MIYGNGEVPAQHPGQKSGEPRLLARREVHPFHCGIPIWVSRIDEYEVDPCTSYFALRKAVRMNIATFLTRYHTELIMGGRNQSRIRRHAGLLVIVGQQTETVGGRCSSLLAIKSAPCRSSFYRLFRHPRPVSTIAWIEARTFRHTTLFFEQSMIRRTKFCGVADFRSGRLSAKSWQALRSHGDVFMVQAEGIPPTPRHGRIGRVLRHAIRSPITIPPE